MLVRKWPAAWLWGAAALALGILVLAGAGVAIVAIVLLRPPAHPAPEALTPPTPPPAVEAPPPPADVAKGDGEQEKEETLKKLVEQDLKENSPNPDGVDRCIDLGVLYLEQNKVPEAEGLFARMAERRPPSAYYFVGRLGLAVTDALKGDDHAAHDKFKELFDPKSRDNRVQILKDYLNSKPEFAKWVNEADSQNVRNGAPPPPVLPNEHHWPGRWPFKKPS